MTTLREAAQQVLQAYEAHESLAVVMLDLKAALAEPDNGGKTGWPPGLLQDDSRGLSKWLASRSDARRRVREALEESVQESKDIQHGWLCPSCGAGNSPMNMRCGCKGWPKMEITC